MDNNTAIMRKTLLWLDDYRDPFDKKIDWLVFSPIGRNVNVIWVKNYDEFVNHITQNGLPEGICFDHDLADEHYRESMYDKDGHYSLYYNDGTFKEKTGYECAKWIIDYCIENKKSLPVFNVHSANPIGRKNIFSILNQYKNFIQNK
jgi:hypothetical protein